LLALIIQAYQLQTNQVSGPAWLSTERYDVTAKIPEGASHEQVLLMLRNLLARRFRLTVHREKKETPVYELVIAKGGVKFKESVPASQDGDPPSGIGAVTLGPDGFPTLPPGGGMRMMPRDGIAAATLHEQTSMETFAFGLTRLAGRPVSDQTGLQGKYDVAMHWVSALPAAGAGTAPPSSGGALPAATDPASGQSLFEALQAQLGLKLEPKKGMIDVLVVDHAEKVPTARHLPSFAHRHETEFFANRFGPASSKGGGERVMRGRVWLLVKMATLLAGAATCLAGQTAAFEVVSVKPSPSLGTGMSISTSRGGILDITNATLRALIVFAYNVRDFQVTGGPSWIDTDRYDIAARPPHDDAEAPATGDAAGASRADLTRTRMQALLADRFKLAILTETNELPIYVLVVARNGPYFELSKTDNPQRGISSQRGLLTCTRVTMKTLAEMGLAPRLGRPVIDKTGLTGEYDFKIQYVDDGPLKPGVEPAADGPDAANDLSGPTLALALQEQLGLKLQSQKGPVRVIVVESAERASAN